MFIKTVSTTSGINPIKFDETGGVFYWILNTGSSTIYASTKSAFTAGDDGVVSLGPKESRRLETNNDTIYILGEGQVEIHNQRDGICSFKQAPTSSGGGGTVDAYTKTESDAKYAQKTDIPASLPANGGNADTVDGMHADDFIYPRGYFDSIDLDDIKYPCSGLALNCIHSPSNVWGTLLAYAGGTGSFIQIYIPIANNDAPTAMYFRHYGDAGWTSWHNTADGGNADTVGGKVPEKIFYDNGLSPDLNSATQPGCYGASPDTLNVPLSSWWLVDTTNFNNQFIVQKAHTIGNPTNTMSYIRNYANDVWSEWKEISTTPIKSTIINGTTDENGNMLLWAVDNRKPLFFEHYDAYSIPFLSGDSKIYLSVHDAYTKEKITNAPMTGTLYYVEM